MGWDMLDRWSIISWYGAISHKNFWAQVLPPTIVQSCRSNLVFSIFWSSIMPASRRAFGIYVSKFGTRVCRGKQIPSLISISTYPLIRIDFWIDLIKDPWIVQGPMILLALSRRNCRNNTVSRHNRNTRTVIRKFRIHISKSFSTSQLPGGFPLSVKIIQQIASGWPENFCIFSSFLLSSEYSFIS